MDKGWVKYHRTILENHFLMRDNNAYIVFSKLLLLVGKAKGEWAGGRRQLADIMGLKDRTVYDVLRRLEQQQMITIKPNQRYTVINICKWGTYQNNPTTAQPTANHSPTTAQHSNKKKKEIKNKKATLQPAAPPAKNDEIARLYYQVINALNLPNINNKHVWAKIELMKTEAPEAELVKYLTFMRDIYPGLKLDYKPHISRALDIYAKRVQIINILKQAKAEGQTAGGFKAKAKAATV